MYGTWASSRSGTSSTCSPFGLTNSTRCALYDGISATRQDGRQLSSQQATRWVGRWFSVSRAMKSSSPRIALVGVPSAAFIVSGTPKNARKYRDAVSSSISRCGLSQPWVMLSCAGRCSGE